MTQAKARVVYCTSGGYFGSLILRQLLDCPRCQVVGVVQSSRILQSRYGWLRGAIQQLRLSGLRYAWYLWCATTLADLLCTLGKSRSVAQLASSHDLPVLTTSDINDAQGQAFLQHLRPGLLISGFFNQRLAERTFAVPPAGTVNIHPSLLPRDKGVDPVFFGSLRGAAQFGVTLHRVVTALDAGAILAQGEVIVDPRDSVFWLTARLFQHGGELLVTQLEPILDGATGREQGSGGNYDSWPTSAQVAALRRRGVALLRLRDLWNLWRGRLPSAAHS